MEKEINSGYTMPMRIRRFLFLSIVVAFFLLAVSHGRAQAEDNAASLLQQLTTEEKIGQLFIVTFKGKDVSVTSDIYQLITQYRIGGVIVKRENGNFRSGAGEAAAVQQLANGLQSIAESAAAQPQASDYIPLFIALSQPGNGFPYDQLATEVTTLPSLMTMGATWQTSHAQEAGKILGGELSALGINMVFAPSLDVLERPNPGTTGDLGTQTFGGDPYWVWRMGKAYIQGIQQGSNRKIAVIATHFPGIGGSDRNPEEEVATVRKAMEDLRLIDLAPFIAVTDGVPGNDGVIDGVLVSHIRYQGLQGNIRTTTRPVSLDPQALTQLMDLSEFKGWREGGGITVSDSLGTQSVRKFYDPTGLTFSNRYIALNAFQAGNDILQLSNFSDPITGDEMQTITDTIRYFQQKYETEEDFAARVDAAVTRILALKHGLYPVFSPEKVQIPAENLKAIGGKNQQVSAICRDGASLISPPLNAQGELDFEPPTAADRILILTDSRQIVPCPGCAVESDLSPTALSDTILRLYGPGASGFVESSHVSSFTFRELYTYLQGTTPSADLEKALTNASIIVALMRNPQMSVPESFAFQNLLAQRSDIVRKKKIIVFGLGAPYYLDSTEISDIDAYYALYSKISPCIETAARLLYRDAAATGDAPVSVESVRYDLLTALSPDPGQLIQVSVTRAEEVSSRPTPTAVQTPTTTATTTPQGFLQGDLLALTAGPILDHNQHMVPDGTIVRFRIEYTSDKIPPLYLDAMTIDGIGQVNYFLERQGEIQITASSDPALNSSIIKLTTGQQPVFITPSGIPAIFPSTPTKEISATPKPSATPQQGSGNDRAGFGSFSLTIFLLSAIAGFTTLLFTLVRPEIPKWRFFLGALIGGLAGYDYISIGLPGAGWLASISGQWMSILFAILGSGVGIAAVWILHRQAGRAEDAKKTD
jgi:beta-N-acetylhexosaminidase